MTRDEFINYLVENDIPYCEATTMDSGNDFVYVYDKKAYRRLEELRRHPRKYKYELEHLCVPYLRVSNFTDWSWYIRDNGICDWAPESVVMGKVKRLGYV